MATILQRIVATKRESVQRAKLHQSEAALRRKLPDAPPVRDFLAALRGGTSIRLIAEVKKASPSKGVIRPQFDPVAIARTYRDHGAACISVLTDEPYFQGRLEYLGQIRDEVDLPVLRKDFIIDSYQVLEARVAGADAVLLIAECLADSLLEELYGLVRQLGMTPLVEFYEPENLPRVLRLGAELIGVNNRNLRTFEVDLGHTIRMRREIPGDRLVVGESGIACRDDVRRLEQAGVQAILVGEALMASPDPGKAIDELLGRR